MKKSDTSKQAVRKLIASARKARKEAYAPYSKFKVGAALLTKSGHVFSGANVENSSYGLTNCAERSAIFKAVSEGEKDFQAIAIVAKSSTPFPPCGACRQVIYEFGADIEVIMANLDGHTEVASIDVLLPKGFRFKPS